MIMGCSPLRSDQRRTFKALYEILFYRFHSVTLLIVCFCGCRKNLLIFSLLRLTPDSCKLSWRTFLAFSYWVFFFGHLIGLRMHFLIFHLFANSVDYSLKRGWEIKSRETARTCSRWACWAFILDRLFLRLYLESALQISSCN